MDIFIAGTDTDVGKTYITAGLCLGLAGSGLRIGVQKWLSTGDRLRSMDLDFIRNSVVEVLGREKAEAVLFSAPYCFSFPSSPHLAAELDGCQVDVERIVSVHERIRTWTDVLLVEGTGGLMVPVTREYLLVDLLKRINPQVILVARSGLGTINHTLLSVEALRSRGIGILCVVLNSVGASGRQDISSPRIVRDNKEIISSMTGIEVFGPVPFLGSSSLVRLQGVLAPVAERICKLHALAEEGFKQAFS